MTHPPFVGARPVDLPRPLKTKLRHQSDRFLVGEICNTETRALLAASNGALPVPAWPRWLPLLCVFALALLLCALPHVAHAATNTSSGNLPWESPLQKFRDSISGPVAFAISLLGIIVCGSMLIWGGEINEFVRRFIMVILVVAVIVLANTILTSLFNTGAVIVPMAHAAAAQATAWPDAVGHALLIGGRHTL